MILSEYNGLSRRHSRRTRRPKPEYERNIVSAFFALTSAVLIAIAEAEPKRLKIDGGRCDGDYLGLYKVIAYKSWRSLGKCLHATIKMPAASHVHALTQPFTRPQRSFYNFLHSTYYIILYNKCNLITVC